MNKLISFSMLACLLLVGAANAASSSTSSSSPASKNTSSNSNHLEKKADPILNLLSMFKEEARGLARLDASLKSVLGNPLTGVVYAASLAIGVITLLAFYESPISPLPVPALPKPPVGRFPPEHSVWPPISKQAQKLQHGPAYQHSSSNLQQAFALPPTFEKSHFNGYEKHNVQFNPQTGQFTNGGQFNGFSQQLGNLQQAGSNLYASILPAPQQQQKVAFPSGHQQANGLLQGQLQASSFQRKSSSEMNGLRQGEEKVPPPKNDEPQLISLEQGSSTQ